MNTVQDAEQAVVQAARAVVEASRRGVDLYAREQRAEALEWLTAAVARLEQAEGEDDEFAADAPCGAFMPNRGLIRCGNSDDGHHCIATVHEVGPQGQDHACLCGARFSLAAESEASDG